MSDPYDIRGNPDTWSDEPKPVKTGRESTELLTHRLNVALRALTLIHEMAKNRNRVNMQDGTSLELFTSSAIREASAFSGRYLQPDAEDLATDKQLSSEAPQASVR